MAKKINVIYTGGTIGMEETEKGLVASSGFEKKFYKAFPEYIDDEHVQFDFTEFEPPIDSSHASLELALEIFKCITSSESGSSAFLVLMGSDTLSFMASALAYLLRDKSLSVLICGSMKPLGQKNSDASENVRTAISELITSNFKHTSLKRVQVAFGGKLLPATRCKKLFADREEAMVDTRGVCVQQNDSNIAEGLPAWTKKNASSFDIRSIRATPEIHEHAIRFALSGTPDACIIECYGSGTLPHEKSPFSMAIKHAANNGIPIFAISQCLGAYVRFDTYASAGWLNESGVCSCGDMHYEAAYTKLWYLLNLGLKGQELKAWMNTNLCGEISGL